MNILGVYSGHDAHFCLLQDGRLTRHYQVDRHTRVKHSAGFHEDVLVAMLKDAGLAWRDIDAVACGGCSWVPGKTSRLFDALVPIGKRFVMTKRGPAGPAAVPFFSDASERLVQGTVRHAGHTVSVYQVDHHLAHCAQAYYMSPFDDAVIVSFDGGGDDAYMLSCLGRGGKITQLEYGGGKPYSKSLSIGNFWTCILPVYKGWRNGEVTDGEGKIMGHAAYGMTRATMAGAIEQAMRDERRWIDGRMAADLERLAVDWADWRNVRLQDFSASLQRVTEQLFVEEVSKRADREGATRVCLSGGCAYNCVANGKVAERYPDAYVPSCPNDAGLALGACLLVWHHVMGNSFVPVREHTPYLGAGRDGHADESAAERVVADLLEGKLVAWFDGRAESGNRALGHRSILADPRLPNVKETINERVKRREWFRPFAPSVLGRNSEWAPGGRTPPSCYMSFSVGVDPRWHERVPGVVHVDGTCRPHFVTRETNPVYYRIIELFHEATGVPMILNTSFNVAEPIVETEEQARATFAQSGLDVLYMNGERSVRG